MVSEADTDHVWCQGYILVYCSRCCIVRGPDGEAPPCIGAPKPDEKEYRCVQGHDLCSTSYAGSDCPYCEKLV